MRESLVEPIPSPLPGRHFFPKYIGRLIAADFGVRLRLLLAGIVIFFLINASEPAAQQSDIIIDIRVEGSSQVERGQILSNLQSRVDEPLNVSNVTQDLRNIFGLKFFQDVRAEVEEIPGEGVILIFTVDEKPRITSVKLVGNVTVTETSLEDKITVKAGNFYTKRLVLKNIEILREEYRKKGYFKAKFRSKVERFTEKSYGLTLIVEETPRLYITKIRTHNNKVFTELEIQRLMISVEIDCFAWITDSGVFDELRINQDLQTISAKYLTNGYIRLLIDKPKVRLTHNREFSRIRVDLTFSEGSQYFTGKIDVVGDILGKKSDLIDRMELKKGDVYNPFKQNRDRFRLNQLYQEQGYAFVRIIPDVKIDDQSKLVDVTYRIIKGDKAYIGRIDFQGNRETRDFVMRREFEVRENELYNGRKLRESQRNLQRLGFFEPGFKVEREPTDVDDILDIVTKVSETQTGTLQAQLGFSDSSGVIVATSVSKGNLFGRGQTLRFSATFGQRNITRSISFDFIEPHLFGSEISSDSSISLINRQDFTGLDVGDIMEERYSQGLGFPIIPLLRLNFTFSIINREFDRPVEEPTSLRSITPSLRYNSVDNPIFPSSGTNAIFAVQQVGGKILGGDTEYRRYRLRVRKFFSLNDANTLIVMSRFRISWLEQIGSNLIPLEDRFRIGGISTLRGYNFSEVGGPFGNLERALSTTNVQSFDDAGQPIINSVGDPVLVPLDLRTVGLSDDDIRLLRSGGVLERLLNLEMLFPLAGNNVRGVVFYDAGEVNAESEQYALLNEIEPGFFDLKQSIGFGIRLISPVGVFRFEYGMKLRPEPGESKDKFDFTISSLF
ncbi:MAG: outer membrane protein assembly factor BamA [SAR324 cluster bacterium]|nr:outer membrane protein assembly factor BamA [SAR324 cluster bacterium]